MKISKVKLANYRNHNDLTLTFDNDVTLIQGLNGAGKSNVLEAIHLLSTGSSTRARYDRDMINYEQLYCSVYGIILKNGDKTELEVQIIKSEREDKTSIKKVKVNKVPKTIHYMVGLFNSVLFSPEDISIITGSPSDRRKFIDYVLIQTDEAYRKHISGYIKAIRQRNKVLEMIRDENRGRDQLSYWDDLVILHGTYLQKERAKFLNDINNRVKGMITKLDSEFSEIEIIYNKNEISQERLARHREHEVSAKKTLVGPHRDDFTIMYNSHNLAEFGSRGQQRTVLLAIKIAEVEYFESEKGEKPILLLDDIFSELDEKHKKTVLENISYQQTIITFAEKPDFIVDNSFGLIRI